MQKDQNFNKRRTLSIDKELALKNFFESAPMMMGIADIEDDDIRYISNNAAAAEMHEMTPEQMDGQTARSLGIPDDSIQYWIGRFTEAEIKEKPVNFEYRHGEKKEKLCSAVVTFMNKTDEGHSRFSYIAQDITSERNTEKELQSLNIDLEKRVNERTEELKFEKSKLDCLLSASPIGIAFLDRDLRYEIINPVLAKLNGLPPEEHIHKKISDVIPEDVGIFTPVLQEIIKTGHQRFNFEFESRPHSDPDKVHYFASNYFPVKKNDEVIGVGATVVDLTERKKIEQELQTREAEVRQIADAMPQIVWTAKPDGTISWYNEQWYKFTGAQRGTHWDDEVSPIHPDDILKVKERWNHSIKTGKDFEVEYRLKKYPEGVYKWHLERGVPIKDEEGQIEKWIGSVTEIQEQKVLVDKLEEEKNLRENFIATLSHDLRTPLTAAKMSAQLMMRRSSDHALNKTAIRIIDNMDRADAMIRDLLDASRIKAGEEIPLQIQRCNLNDIAEETLNELSTIHGDRFVLRSTEIIEGLWSCSAIRRIIENLCSNAVKYGFHNTPVTISIRKVDEQACLEVHNQGKPIPKEVQAHLFEPFKRASDDQTKTTRGWGLGLTLVKGLTESHKGKVSVESSESTGTLFKVKLPLYH